MPLPVRPERSRPDRPLRIPERAIRERQNLYRPKAEYALQQALHTQPLAAALRMRKHRSAQDTKYLSLYFYSYLFYSYLFYSGFQKPNWFLGFLLVFQKPNWFLGFRLVF